MIELHKPGCGNWNCCRLIGPADAQAVVIGAKETILVLKAHLDEASKSGVVSAKTSKESGLVVEAVMTLQTAVQKVSTWGK